MNKKIKKSILPVLAAVGVMLAAAGVSQANEVDFSYRYWLPHVSGTVGPATVSGVLVDSVDIKHSLGIENRNVGDFRLSLAINKTNKLNLDYLDTSFSGTGQPGGQIAGVPFLAGIDYHTDVKTKNAQLSWTRYLNKDMEDDTVMGVVAGLRNVKIDATSVPVGGGNTLTKNFDVIFPSIGFTVETGRTGPVKSFMELSGAYAGSRGYFYDGSAGIKTSLGEDNSDISFTAGYRVLEVKAKNSGGDNVKSRLSGPFFNVTFKF